MDLSPCSEVKVDIYSPVNLNQDYLDLIEQIKDQGYDIFNPNDSFYNDICTPYNSMDETDVIIKDRKVDFYNDNITLCEDTCNYKSFDTNNSIVKCECQIKKEINSNIYETEFSAIDILENFYSFENYTNYKVLKCYFLVFDSEKLKYNFGNYIFILILLFFIGVSIFNIFRQKRKYEEIFNTIAFINQIIDQRLKGITKNKEEENHKIKTVRNDNKDNEKKKKKKKKNARFSNIFKPKKEDDVRLREEQENIQQNDIKSIIDDNHSQTKKSLAPKKEDNTRLNKSNNISSERMINVYNFKEKNDNNINNKNIITKINDDEQKIERIEKIIELLPEEERYKYFIDSELNSLKYVYAINIDFRTFFQCYCSLLNEIHPILFTFIIKNDYNLFLSKLSLFIMSFALNIVVNTLFFFDESMHILYKDFGRYNLIFNLPQTIYSILLSNLITYLFELLALSDDILINFKEKQTTINNIDEKQKIIKFLKIKSILFFNIGIIVLLFFWYYLSSFCAVYYNTQKSLIKNILISYFTGLMYPFLFAFILASIRISALRRKKIFIYRINQIISFIIYLI